MKTSLLVSAFFAAFLLPVQPQPLECDGCHPSDQVSPGAGVTITETVPLEVTEGLCEGNPCAQETPCTVKGDLTVTNTTASLNVFLRSRGPDGCNPGTTTIGPGDSWNLSFPVGGEELNCGDGQDWFFYLSDPGSDCSPGSATASIRIACTSCVGHS